MEVKGIDYLCLGVADLERSKAFYMDVLGMETYAVEPAKVFLICGADILSLTWMPDASAAQKVHFGFLIHTEHDMEEWKRQLVAKGVAIEREERFATSWSICFQDPDGHRIEMMHIF